MNPNSNNDSNKELIEALKTEEDEVVETREKSVLGLQMKKIIFFLILITVLLIVTLWLLSLTSSDKKDNYSTYEKKMVTAAKEYYKVNKDLLPSENNRTNEVTLSKLVELKYMEDYSKLKSCSGSVTVEKNNDSYNYTSYLDCGDSYTSKILFNRITDSNNIVTNDSGLYRLNNEYVYRGEKPNNYVKFSDRIWRIVKVDANGDIVLILDDYFEPNYLWDDRYNSEMQYNYGYNDYSKSRIRDYLDKTYEDSINETNTEFNLLTKNAAKKLVGFRLCSGKIDLNQGLTNNTYECASVVENTKIGLLTASDYVTASVDPSCTNINSETCQNYNYLSARSGSWWLATANSTNTHEAYIINHGVIRTDYAYSYYGIRPVIHLRKNTTYTSGKGTENKPYVIK